MCVCVCVCVCVCLSREEGTSAVREAIRIALHDNNTKLLQHCLVS